MVGWTPPPRPLAARLGAAQEKERPRMWQPQTEEEWDQLAHAAFSGIIEWRLRHPTATWAELETTVDQQMAQLRARMLQDVAQASAATDLTAAGPPAACPHCGTPLRRAGRRQRQLTTDHEQPITLTRQYARCPRCGTGLFPPG
jgi:hypothetical protein